MRARQQMLAMSLMLVFAVCSADTLDPEIANTDAPRTTSELVRLCVSDDPDRSVYCDGYIAVAVFLWKASLACDSHAPNDQLFCAGATDARSAVEETLSSCSECDQEVEREKLRDALKAAGDLCIPDERHNEHYCAGYNAAIEFATVSLLPFQTPDVRDGPRYAGLLHGANDLILHLMASADIHYFMPCIQLDVPQEDIRAIYLHFVSEYPAQTSDLAAVISLAKSLYYGLCPGPERGLKPHMEACTTWDYENGEFGTRNVCDKAVFVQFKEEGQGLIERELKPGETLLTGRSREPDRRVWWMFSTCPLDYVSTPVFTEANKDEIQASRYSCVPG